MKIYPNLKSTKMQQLISLLGDLEHTTDKECLEMVEKYDNIFELLGMPKYGDMIKDEQRKKNDG